MVEMETNVRGTIGTTTQDTSSSILGVQAVTLSSSTITTQIIGKPYRKQKEKLVTSLASCESRTHVKYVNKKPHRPKKV